MDEAHYCAEAFSPITGHTGNRARNRTGRACAVSASAGPIPRPRRTGDPPGGEGQSAHRGKPSRRRRIALAVLLLRGRHVSQRKRPQTLSGRPAPHPSPGRCDPLMPAMRPLCVFWWAVNAHCRAEASRPEILQPGQCPSVCSWPVPVPWCVSWHASLIPAESPERWRGGSYRASSNGVTTTP
jgi:hypothetical protein